MNTCFDIKNLTFSYPEQSTAALQDINLSINAGEFVTLCGPSGCGKTTLLRQLKRVLAPHGSKRGQILFEGKPLEELNPREQSGRIGFVMQNPDNQIVTDKVWHELAFGLESLGYDTATIRRRVAEMSSFFGIQSWFYKDVSELSGGQKQLLNLASIMAMQPAVLILDEPTSQLDPIAAADFLATVGKINRELGITILMTEHRLEEVFPMSDRVIVMDGGRIICQGGPSQVGESLKDRGHSMFLAMPAPMRIYAAVSNELKCPVTVRDGRMWLADFSKTRTLKEVHNDAGTDNKKASEEEVLALKEVWFKYEKNGPDVLKDLSLSVKKGEFLAILGGNGTGKTTMLSLLSDIYKPYRGRVMSKGFIGTLPQNPSALFVKKTVREDLREVLQGKNLSKEEQEQELAFMLRLCRLENLKDRHPYDLSGGEQQRAALGKTLLLKPHILLLDEPTKGFDAEFKQIFAEILQGLLQQGITIVMVSHDIEFCAKYAQRCALFFDGSIIATDQPQAFFSGNSFYTTAANRMARHLLPNAVTAEHVICACGGRMPPPPELPEFDDQLAGNGNDGAAVSRGQAASKGLDYIQTPGNQRKLSKRTAAAAAMILLAIPLTIYAGIFYFDDRKYYFISLLIILETMLPFFLIFEGRKPQARELIIIAVLCAIGVAGRAAFFMVPQFKPVAAIVILAGVAFGGETGFLVGAVTMMVSNMMFGQGPWTPWQMFAMGIIGFLAGVLFRKGWLLRSRVPLCIFGGLAALIIYGGLMNPSSVLMHSASPTWPMFLTAYVMGFPFDLIHAGATMIFLWFISQPMLEKLDRLKVKYGLVK